MGSQFSEEFLLGYRAGHRDGFADATLLMRDSATSYGQALSLARRQEQLDHLLSGGGLVAAPEPGKAEGTATGVRRDPEGKMSKFWLVTLLALSGCVSASSGPDAMPPGEMVAPAQPQFEQRWIGEDRTTRELEGPPGMR